MKVHISGLLVLTSILAITSFANTKPNQKRVPASIMNAKAKFSPDAGFEKNCKELIPQYETSLTFDGASVVIPTKNSVKGEWVQGQSRFRVASVPELMDFLDFEGLVFGAELDPISGRFSYWENFMHDGVASGQNLECNGKFVFKDPTDAIRAKVVADKTFRELVNKAIHR